MTAKSDDPDVARLLDIAKRKAMLEWGRPAWRLLGQRIQQAMVAEAVLAIVAAQRDDITGARLLKIASDGLAWVTDRAEDR